MKPVKTSDELMERLNTLPAFSKIVYDAIQESMYAEPGFSDTMPRDIAKELKVSVKAIGGALTELQDKGLIWLDTDGVNGTPMTFIHTYEHDDEIERIK